MKATELIKNKGIEYAKDIVESAPDGVLAWNEGYEFVCGTAINISDEDREKYFVDMSDLKRLVESHELVEKWQGLNAAKIKVVLLRIFGLTTQADQLEQAVTDVESCQ